MTATRRFTWPLRSWLLLFLLGVAVLAFAGMIVSTLFISEEWPVRDDVKDRIVAERRLWESDEWQVDIALALQQEGMAVQLFDEKDRLLFRSDDGPAPAAPTSAPGGGDVKRRWVDHIEVFRDGLFVGHARIAHPWLGLIDNRGTNWSSIVWMATAIGVSALVTTSLGMWLLSRIVLTPLARLSDAAEDIRRGRLDVTLPRSRVREVQQLIDDFQRMVDGLQQSIERQAAVEEERRFFLAAIAHDLRTPLFSLRGRLEGMRNGVAKTPERIRYYLNVALRRVSGLEKLVADLFAYSRMELTEYEPERRDVDIRRLIQTSAESIETAAIDKGVSLSLNGRDAPHPRSALSGVAADTDPVVLWGDGDLLTRALDNLLSNALRHTPKGGTIDIGCRLVNDRVHIWVADTGEGLPDPVLQRLTAKTSTISPFHYRADGGLGLGLTIVRRVAELHNGTLTVCNRPGGGARFVIDMPR